MNPWDKLSDFFNVRVEKDQVQGGAMDNILIAWPPIVELIIKTFPKIENLKALDFGCGVGEFCHKLYKLGFSVTGIDISPKMIEKARSYLPKEISLIAGDSSTILPNQKYDLITSIQTFQFIEDIERTVSNLSKALMPNGLIIFATFNPQFIINCIKENVLLVDFDSSSKPTKGIMKLGDIQIPTFIRTAEEYTKLFYKFKFTKVLETYPPFTDEFLKKYPLRVPPDKIAPTQDPEFLIMAFRRTRKQLSLALMLLEKS